MRTWMRPWLAIAALLAALGGTSAPAAGSVTDPPAEPADGTLFGDALAPRSEALSGPALDALVPARPLDARFSATPLDDSAEPLALAFFHRGPRKPRAPGAATPLGGMRARILLRSLTLPGWGQATLGRRKSAVFFGLTETAIWGTFAAFRIQVAMRDDALVRTARLQAGIDLEGRDEEWRRIVGGYASSDEYNLLVVARDAANLYLSDPVTYGRAPGDSVPYFAYIESHKLQGSDTWVWSSAEAQRTYRDLRKTAQRAAQRANTALAVAVVNRILSALHAARAAGQPAHAARTWQLEVVPVASADATAFQFRVHARF
jgi:hypothetical protein